MSNLTNIIGDLDHLDDENDVLTCIKVINLCLAFYANAYIYFENDRFVAVNGPNPHDKVKNFSELSSKFFDYVAEKGKFPGF